MHVKNSDKLMFPSHQMQYIKVCPYSVQSCLFTNGMPHLESLSAPLVLLNHKNSQFAYETLQKLN